MLQMQTMPSHGEKSKTTPEGCTQHQGPKVGGSLSMNVLFIHVSVTCSVYGVIILMSAVFMNI